MSKTTLAIIAAASACAGASLTAVIFSSRRTPSSLSPTPTTPLPPTKTSPSPPIPSYPSTSPPPLVPVNPSGILQYGFPGPISDTLSTPSHLSSFNRFTRNPHWVAEHFTPASLSLSNASRRLSVFHEDDTVPPIFRAKLADYARSGYDRGHQVPAADAKWSQAAMDSTFVLSNMCPQVGDGFNRDYWAHLEEFCRELVRKYPSVRVITGPLYLPRQDEGTGKWKVEYEVIGHPPNVAVPTHFYKVVFAEEAAGSPICGVALGAFVLPNTPIPNDKSLRDFEVPVEAIERASGLTFAEKLAPERRKRLCQEVKCEILVREFDRSKQQGSLVNAGQQTARQMAKEGTGYGPDRIGPPPPSPSGPDPVNKSNKSGWF